MSRWTPEMELLAAIIGCMDGDVRGVSAAARLRLSDAIAGFAVDHYPSSWRALLVSLTGWLAAHIDCRVAPVLRVRDELNAALDDVAAMWRLARPGAPTAADSNAGHFGWQDRADING